MRSSEGERSKLPKPRKTPTARRTAPTSSKGSSRRRRNWGIISFPLAEQREGGRKGNLQRPTLRAEAGIEGKNPFDPCYGTVMDWF